MSLSKRIRKSKFARRMQFGEVSEKENMPYIRLWVFRILVHLGGSREFVDTHGFNDDGLAEFLGFDEHLTQIDYDDFKASSVKATLIEKAKDAEEHAPKEQLPKSLNKNIDQVAKLIGLSNDEQYLLGFAILMSTERFLEVAGDYLNNLTSNKTYRALSVILDIPEHDLKSMLGANGTLCRSGLLKMNSGPDYLNRKLELISSNFADAILIGESDPIELFKETVSKSTPPHLSLDDYPHIEQQLSILKPLLKNAIANKIPGINIYIHGPAGTGKTQLAKALSKTFDTELFEITCEDEDGDPISGDRRLRALSAAQSFLKKREAILLFDEVEDVFNDEDGHRFLRSTAQSRKAWINRTLEENIIPVFWLSNTRYGLDPAFVRRYSMVFELKVPPKSQRIKVLDQYAGNIASPTIIKQLAESEHLAPAVISNASRVISIIDQDIDESSKDRAFAHLVNQTLEAQDYKTVNISHTQKPKPVYSTEYLNASVDIETLITGLQRHRSARVCFYGPPGTGKTALGHHIAETLDLPIICKKVSDLMSMWVGGTEENIAEAFRQATEEKAILLIDEVDSFLQERAGAQRSWEMTQVNEMLTQMENFEGIFIASTNLVDLLDNASIRRFDAKIKFDYMTPHQTCQFIATFCQQYAIDITLQEINNRCNTLTGITPGDFALLARQNHFYPLESFEQLIERLLEEQALKGIDRPRMGFI